MTQYAKLRADLTLEKVVELTPEQFAGMQVNGKAALLRLFVAVPAPVPTAQQVVEPGPFVVDAINCTQSWVLRNKTATELTVDELTVERAALVSMVTELRTQMDIDAAAFNAATAAQKLAILGDDRRLVLRIVRFLLRSELVQFAGQPGGIVVSPQVRR